MWILPLALIRPTHTITVTCLCAMLKQACRVDYAKRIHIYTVTGVRLLRPRSHIPKRWITLKM